NLQLADEFIGHLTHKNVLRDAAVSGGLNGRGGDSLGDIDWVGLTKLTAAAFADELAAFCGCKRVQRSELVNGLFAGAQLSPRFHREGRLFPYENESGILTLAIARPMDGETVRAIEIALRRPVALAIATADDIDAALGTSLEPERAKVDEPGEPAAGEDS